MNALRHVVQTLRVSSRVAVERTGISGAQLFVLHQLAAAPADSLDEIARRTLTHQSSVSVVVSRLVARGLVARHRSPSDGRRVQLALTAAGRRLLTSAPPIAQTEIVAALGRLDPALREGLARGLVALVKAMGLDQHPPALFFEGEMAIAPRAVRSRRARA